MHDANVTMLSNIIDNLDLCKDLLVTNYDKKPVGQYHVGVYKEALQIIDKDFPVASFEDNSDIATVVIEEMNSDILNDFIYRVKVKDSEHDKDFGDGKYWREG